MSQAGDWADDAQLRSALESLTDIERSTPTSDELYNRVSARNDGHRRIEAYLAVARRLEHFGLVPEALRKCSQAVAQPSMRLLRTACTPESVDSGRSLTTPAVRRHDDAVHLGVLLLSAQGFPVVGTALCAAARDGKPSTAANGLLSFYSAKDVTNDHQLQMAELQMHHKLLHVISEQSLAANPFLARCWTALKSALMVEGICSTGTVQILQDLCTGHVQESMQLPAHLRKQAGSEAQRLQDVMSSQAF